MSRIHPPPQNRLRGENGILFYRHYVCTVMNEPHGIDGGRGRAGEGKGLNNGVTVVSCGTLRTRMGRNPKFKTVKGET